jgi:serine/threonine protein kinase
MEKYGKECDYWSLGVLSYVLLSGTMPFYDEERDSVFRKIMKCDYNFNDKIWS